MIELTLMGACQGRANDDWTPISPYMRVVSRFEESLPRQSTCLFLGGGAYILPHLFGLSGHHVTVYEKDLYVYSRQHPTHLFCNKNRDAAYAPSDYSGDPSINFIMLDCYTGFTPVSCLFSTKYLVKLKKLLLKDGVLCINYIPTVNTSIAVFKRRLAVLFSSCEAYSIYDVNNIPRQTVYFCSGDK